jgi:hypothetical protein
LSISSMGSSAWVLPHVCATRQRPHATSPSPHAPPALSAQGVPPESFDDLTTTYHKQWQVECYHKSLKQNVSLAKSPTQTVTTQTNHFFAALCGFVKLERLKNGYQAQSFCAEVQALSQCAPLGFRHFTHPHTYSRLRVRWGHKRRGTAGPDRVIGTVTCVARAGGSVGASAPPDCSESEAGEVPPLAHGDEGPNTLSMPGRRCSKV